MGGKFTLYTSTGINEGLVPERSTSKLPTASSSNCLNSCFRSSVIFSSFQSSNSYSISSAFANNDILLLHRHIRLTRYIGRAILLRHSFVRYIPNDSLRMRKAMLAESGDNKRIRRERHTLHPTIPHNIADCRTLREQRGNRTDATL